MQLIGRLPQGGALFSWRDDEIDEHAIPLVPADAGTQALPHVHLHQLGKNWIPAPCFAKAKPLWLRGGDCAGMSGWGWRD
jgi:hypothetical protein